MTVVVLNRQSPVPPCYSGGLKVDAHLLHQTSIKSDSMILHI